MWMWIALRRAFLTKIVSLRRAPIVHFTLPLQIPFLRSSPLRPRGRGDRRIIGEAECPLLRETTRGKDG